MPIIRSRSCAPAKSAISSAWPAPEGLSKSRIMRHPMSRSLRASSTAADTPAHTVSTGTPSLMTNPGEKNISR